MKYLALALVLCVGCARKQEKPPVVEAVSSPAATVMHQIQRWEPCSDSVDDAVLDKLYGKFPQYNEVEAEDENLTRKDLDVEQRTLDKLIHWANGLSDRCQKDAYLHWLDYYQNNLNEAYVEVDSHARQKDYNEWLAKENERDRATRQYEATHKVPSPPLNP